MTYVVWDVETTTHTLAKRKASPWHPDNFVVASGFKRKGGEPKALYTRTRGGLPKDWFTRMLRDTKVLVGFNVGFDLLHALQEPGNLEAWMEYVAGGGQIWDCQLVEYLLDGMQRESHMLSLDEVAPRYGGNLKVDEVKTLWASGVQTNDIPEDLLIRYLIGDGTDHGDIGNTEAIFLGQLKKLRTNGQFKSVLLNNGALLCTIEMMRNGMYVDQELGLQIAQELREALYKKTEELTQYLPPDLPFEFNWGSRFHLSALIFGGAIKYKAKATVLDDEGHPVYYQTDALATSYGGEWLTEAPEGVEPDRFTSGKNKGQPKTKKVKVPDLERGPKTRYEEFMYEFPGLTDPDKRWESSDPGVYSVASEVIEELALRDIPFLALLGEVTKIRKDLTTYYTTDEENPEDRKGMLNLVGADGIIHHMINMTSTVTGRFSSSNPNLQNIPQGRNSRIKEVFKSRFPGGSIIGDDFTSLEVYVQAMLTRDKQLVADLLDGLDMHCARLSVVEGKPYEEVLALCKGPKATPEWEGKRTDIKVFSFQRAYGAGAPKIAAGLKRSVEEVEEWILADRQRYPQVDAYYEYLTAEIQKSRKPTSRFVMHPELRGVTVQLGRGFYQTPDGKKYTYEESPAPGFIAKKGTLANFSPTEIRNYVVQGMGGEVMKAAMWLMVRSFYASQNFGGLALLVNTVHDAAYADAHPQVRDKAAALVHACMLAASDFIEYLFKWDIPVQVPSEVHVGSSMMEEDAVPAGVITLANKLRSRLRVAYMEGFVPSTKTKEQ